MCSQVQIRIYTIAGVGTILVESERERQRRLWRLTRSAASHRTELDGLNRTNQHAQAVMHCLCSCHARDANGNNQGLSLLMSVCEWVCVCVCGTATMHRQEHQPGVPSKHSSKTTTHSSAPPTGLCRTISRAFVNARLSRRPGYRLVQCWREELFILDGSCGGVGML